MLHFDPSQFAHQRQQVLDAMGTDSAAIFVASPERIRSNDTHFKYRASSDIVYLTGFEEPETVVVLAPGHDLGDFFMFVRNRDPLREQWDGRRFGTEGAEKVFQADKAYTLDQLDDVLPKLIAHRERLYYTLGQDKAFDEKISNLLNRLRYQRYSASIAPSALLDARDLVHRRRMVKSEKELALMERAAQISAKAHELAMAYTKPGVWEYQLESVIAHHFRMNGASGAAYESIVGTGENATILHYIENNAQLKEGEVLLVDAGCEYNYYAADISRSWPVSGTFTPEQRDLYNIVLDCELKCIDRVRSGVKYNEIKAYAARLLTEGMVSLGILKGDVDDILESGAYRPYYPHSIGHYLGLDVHDVGTYYTDDGGDIALQPGMVVTIEPGLYFPLDDTRVPEPFRGVGIRIEDDIACTEGDPRVLSSPCAKTVDEVEALVGSAHQ